MADYFRVLFFTSLLVALPYCLAGLGPGHGTLPCWACGWLGLNSFIQIVQMYTYKIPMDNRVRIIAYQTHTRLPNEWRFYLIFILREQFLSHTRTLI
jgi:hypothetical protein